MTRDEVLDYIQKAQFGYLATVGEDGAPNVRPVSIKDVYGDDFYFFTFVTTRKVAEIEHNPVVVIAWSIPGGVSQVRVRGKARVVDDPEIVTRFKQDNPMVEKILPAQAQHLFQLYAVAPEKVEAAEGLVPYSKVDW